MSLLGKLTDNRSSNQLQQVLQKTSLVIRHESWASIDPWSPRKSNSRAKRWRVRRSIKVSEVVPSLVRTLITRQIISIWPSTCSWTCMDVSLMLMVSTEELDNNFHTLSMRVKKVHTKRSLRSKSGENQVLNMTASITFELESNLNHSTPMSIWRPRLCRMSTTALTKKRKSSRLKTTYLEWLTIVEKISESW